jgi:hypothetical protein
MAIVAGRSTESLEVTQLVFANWIAIAVVIVGGCLVFTSAWLKGRSAFVLTIICVLGPLVLLSVPYSPYQSWFGIVITILMNALVGGLMFYIVGARYLTRSTWDDNTYQTRHALIGYIKRNNVRSPLAAILPAMGPILLTCAMVWGLMVIWPV